MKRFTWLAVAALVVPLGLVGPTSAHAAPNNCASPAQLINQTPPAFTQMGISTAWRLSSGRDIRVAVVDSGVNTANPHLSKVVDPGTSLVDAGDGRTDAFGTGTAIASLIAATAVKGSGLIGVAPNARILPVKVFESTEDGKLVPDAARTAEGIRWATGQPGVRVIVVGQAAGNDSPAMRSAVADATARGALVVAAVGEASTDNPEQVTFPAGYDQALAVTAVDASGAATPSSLRGVHVEIAAPGAQVLAAYSTGDCLLGTDKPSTAYAAGYAAGVAALVAAAHTDETPADWQYRLLATALRPSPGVRNKTTGWGMIAPYAAINFVNDGSLPGPTNPRFPPPAPQVNQNMPRPIPEPPNPVPPIMIISIVSGVAISLATGGLMLARLRTAPSRRQRRR